MSDLQFMMGEYEARFPSDRLYGKNHIWARLADDGIYRIGLTAYAVRLLQDVYFLDISVGSGSRLEAKQEIGSIESKKAESSLYTPIAGTVTNLNEDLMQDPTAINLDAYGEGWFFEIRSDGDGLLAPHEYLQHLSAAWKTAQRTIKGQINES